MMMNHLADVVFYIRLIQIFIEIHGHQSSNWLNNSVKLPPFSNDLDKNCPKYVIFDTLPFVSISSRFAHSALSSDVSPNANMQTESPICHKMSFAEIIFFACLECSSDQDSLS